MRKSVLIIFVTYLAIQFPIYGVEETNDANVSLSRVRLLNLYIAESYTLLDKNIEFSDSYMKKRSNENRTERSIHELLKEHDFNINETKELLEYLVQDERIEENSLLDLKDDIEKLNRSRTPFTVHFTYADQPEYTYGIEPWGVWVNYYVTLNYQNISIEDLDRKRIKFINETNERIFEVRNGSSIDDFSRLNSRPVKRYGAKVAGGNIVTGIKEVYLDNETLPYDDLMNGIQNYKLFRDSNENVEVLYSMETKRKFFDVTFIGEYPPHMVDSYGYLFLNNYYRNTIGKEEEESTEMESKLVEIQKSLTEANSSSEYWDIIQNLRSFKLELLPDMRERLDSLDSFRISNEHIIENMAGTWPDIIFGKQIRVNANYQSEILQDLERRYETMEAEKEDLFDISVAIYSTSLQRENFETQLSEMKESTEKQIWTAWMGIVVAIAIALGTALGTSYVNRRSLKEQFQKMEELTEKQITASQENISDLISEIKKLIHEKVENSRKL